MAAVDRVRRWSWVTLAAALAVAGLFLWATERRYFEYARWTYSVSGSVKRAIASASGDAGVLSVELELAAPEVSLPARVDSVEFTLTRGGEHLGYFYTFPGELAVAAAAGASGYQRVTVTKAVAPETACRLFDDPPPLGEDVVGAVQLKGDIVVRIGLVRGERLARVPVSGEVTRDHGRR